MLVVMMMAGIAQAVDNELIFCRHKNVDKTGDLIWCKECGEILADVAPKTEFSLKCCFNLDNMIYRYNGVEYINLKYVIKKINGELGR